MIYLSSRSLTFFTCEMEMTIPVLTSYLEMYKRKCVPRSKYRHPDESLMT